ncbi:MAG: polysaccharide biosynthesis/export family protein [Planctomycetota bacterium]|jgi:polysaccharide export outer membrane protein
MMTGSKTWGVLVLVLLCSGCANHHEDLLKFLKEHEHLATATEYRVGIPDSIAISAPRVLEIDGEDQTVGVDGKISLRLLGPVRVVGMTPKEIGAKLQELLKPYYEDPKVQVVVAEHASKKYYVFGEVNSPGPQPYTGMDSLIDGLSAAGPTFIAWRSQIQVVRPNPDPSQRVRIRVDVDQMINTGDLRMNVLLEPGDIVFVPPTPLGWIGKRIQEVLQPFMPVLDAYQLPADVMYANDYYTDDDYNGRSRRRARRR